MGQRIFVISDLHMAAKSRGFFSAQDALSKFIAHVAATPGEVDLVILGDALDYLQIEPYLDFTAPVAADKTDAIIDGNQPVFAALRAFVEQAGKRLRWVIGNHDLELLFPVVRELLEHEILGQPAGRVARCPGISMAVTSTTWRRITRSSGWFMATRATAGTRSTTRRRKPPCGRARPAMRSIHPARGSSPRC